MTKTILSLCDYTGNWPSPYRDAGYDVLQFDVQSMGRDGDIRLLRIADLPPIHGILAAPPCTVFANSGARWPRTDEAMIEGLSIVDAVIRLAWALKPEWWVMENPVGKLTKIIGPPRMYFNPCDYGDPYTKRPGLWGDFNADLPLSPVEPTEGSKMHTQYGGKSAATKNARSATPMGFARAFFAANP